jgi:hypothetical protein
VLAIDVEYFFILKAKASWVLTSESAGARACSKADRSFAGQSMGSWIRLFLKALNFTHW